MRRIAFVLSLVALALCVGPQARAQSPGSENPCPLTARLTAATASAVIVGGNGANSIRVCFYSLSLANAATTTAQLVWGTGSTCGTGTVSASPKLSVGTVVTNPNVPFTAGNGYGFIDENPSRGVSSFCLIVSGSSPSVDGVLKYGLY